jgi:hypothetical protein
MHILQLDTIPIQSIIFEHGNDVNGMNITFWTIFNTMQEAKNALNAGTVLRFGVLSDELELVVSVIGPKIANQVINPTPPWTPDSILEIALETSSSLEGISSFLEVELDKIVRESFGATRAVYKSFAATRTSSRRLLNEFQPMTILYEIQGVNLITLAENLPTYANKLSEVILYI